MSETDRKRVVLIGDSIRIAYQKHVQEELKDVAEVWGPETREGWNTEVLLWHIHDFVLARKPDVVHINSGLHDAATGLVTGKCQVGIEIYEAFLRCILRIIQQGTTAKIIWATTTPVKEAPQLALAPRKPVVRYVIDNLRYNAVSQKVARELKIPVNDLAVAMHEADPEKYWAFDGVHFTDEGSRLLGQKVAAAIREHGLKTAATE